jgi:hypothetical protein
MVSHVEPNTGLCASMQMGRAVPVEAVARCAER